MECKGALKNTIETPDFGHIKSSSWEFVYEPAEDTYLLLDALEKDLNYILLKGPRTVLEVGSGSGILITALSKVLSSSSHCLAVDINKHACKITNLTSSHNHSLVDVIQGDLTSCLKHHVIDLMVFNPPYVVTPSAEVHSKDFLTRSWAGGINGTEVINRFLDLFPAVLSSEGFGYLLVLKENQPHEIMNKLKKKQFDCEVIAKRKIRCEELFVLKFVKKFL